MRMDIMNNSLNKVLVAAALSSALFSSFSATAGSDVNLKVIGSIVPGACVPTLPNGGIVDFGTWRNFQIDPTGVTNKLIQFGQKTIALTVTCDTEISVALTSTDNRSNSVSGLDGSHFIVGGAASGANIATSSNAFGLGKASNGASIGSYTIAMDPVATTIDGVNADLIQSNDMASGSPTWATSSSLAFCGVNRGCSVSRGISVAAKGSVTPKAFKVWNSVLLVTAAVQDNTILGTADTITLDGNSTISLVYL